MCKCLPPREKIVAEAKFASQIAKMFPNKLVSIFGPANVFHKMFSSFPTLGNMTLTKH